MAKYFVAYTRIKLGPGSDDIFEPGSIIDTSRVSKTQLRELYDVGAIEIKDDEDSIESVDAKTDEESPVTSDEVKNTEIKNTEVKSTDNETTTRSEERRVGKECRSR